MGDRQENLKKALDFISQRMRIEKQSPMYDTEPVGDTAQPRFLNMVCQVMTSIPAGTLLFLLQGIENKMGRLPAKHEGPRPIDIDILLYDDQIINTPTLKIPHPRMIERAVVLVPLADIAPDVVHPVQKRTIKELLDVIRTKGGIQDVMKFE
jgi:GTP cyclohydrolase-4